MSHRLSLEEAIRHPRRAAILTAVAENPGIQFRELAAALGVSKTPIDYHTHRLIRSGLLRDEKRGQDRHFYPVEVA